MGLFVCVELLWHCQDGSVWINSNNFNIWIFFLDFSSNSWNSTSSSCSNNNDINLSLTLVPDFLSSLIVVSKSVIWVSILIKNKRVWIFHIQSLALLVEWVRIEISTFTWSSNNLSTQSGHDVLLFSRHLLRHTDSQFIVLYCTNHSKGNSSISWSGFIKLSFRSKFSSSFSILNHSKSNSIFHGTRWIEKFTFC